MQLALRPYVTAGVALVGASVIVANPMAATPPDIRVSEAAVQLAASPFDVDQVVLGHTTNNAEALLGDVLSPPGPGRDQGGRRGGEDLGPEAR